MTADGPKDVLSRRVFFRGLALVYFIAFVSLAVQIVGLVGEHGILPAKEWLALLDRDYPNECWHLAPTILWFDASDLSLCLVCWSGAALSILLFLDFAPGWIAFALWTLYLSISAVGRDFLAFQWDNLLLETGLLAVFYAPWRIRRADAAEEEPSKLARWLVWWLAARLMFESGFAKWASGDPHWRDVSALDFHFETQPIPTLLGYYFQHLPHVVLASSCVLMFAIELGLPFAIVFGRSGRRVACGGFVLLQILIAATGNYGFFNVLTVVISLALLDDDDLVSIAPFLKRRTFELRERTYTHGMFVQIAAGIVGVLSSIELARMIAPEKLPEIVERPLVLAEPFRSVNRYGLFAVMTTSRPEIVVEGSSDGVEWKPYRFRWKIDAKDSAPPFVAPYMPRLDWQMWFEDPERGADRWFAEFVRRLLLGTPEVSALLADDPFGAAPPKSIRARVRNYRFTPLGATGWWTSDDGREFLPPVELDEHGDLRLAGR